MEKPLAQEEIDALLVATRSRQHRAVADHPSVPFSFSRSGQINNEQMRAISLLNDIFARNLTHNLGAFLRPRFHVALATAEQFAYAEFLLRIPDICYVVSVPLEPTRFRSRMLNN